MLSFKLPDAFVAAYADRPVPWGYTDVAGNSVGEITFLRTYSRLKDDGTKETWVDVCRRVIEGMFSIQKDHAKTNRLPWNDHKAQATAQDAFDRLFNLKWTPPGRGLWMMGTPLVNEHKNSAALQNPLRGTTPIVTRDGLRQISDVAGTTVEVWADGDWRKALVSAMGVQPVQEITFEHAGRSLHRVTEVATPDHGWILAHGTKTHALKVGDRVAAAAPDVRDEHYDDGFRAGLIFGDGSAGYRYKNGDISHMIRLCGAKARFASLFDVLHYQPNCNGDPVAYYRHSRNLKELPPSDSSAGYVRGFVDGWKAADGTATPGARSWSVFTQNAEAASWLVANAALGGYIVTGHSVTNRPTNYGERSAPLHSVRIAEPGGRQTSWTVESITPLPEPEEVYCMVVPEAGWFTLGSGIASGNCAFVSTSSMTKTDPAAPFAFLMEASMLGIGVGFDVLGAEKGFTVYSPRIAENGDRRLYVIPDTREGWVESVAFLLESYLKPGEGRWEFDYSQIRPAGAPIRTFGGTAAGPDPLRRLHEGLRRVLDARIASGPAKIPPPDWRGTTLESCIRDVVRGRISSHSSVTPELVAEWRAYYEEPTLTTTDLLDIGNLIGVCVVSGNVRRSAELALGSIDDPAFLSAKDYVWNDEAQRFEGAAADRAEWGWMSNNSVAVNVGDDLSGVIEGIKRNGEPGLIWMDLSRAYGRLIDPPNNRDHRAMGYNPCAEQTLESYECCTLVETYLNRHDDLEDYKRTLKIAYMYGKTVTLLPTHWERTNAIMMRNRRIGTSMSGIANFADRRGLSELRRWMTEGYNVVQHYDRVYSEWLCVRESIKTTTVKPSGTVSILAGESPGAHWAPGGEFFYRLIRFSKDAPEVQFFRWAGYRVEPAYENPDTTVVVYFPIRSAARRSELDVSVFEKAHLAATAQRHWSDNSVSVTLSFDPETEADDIAKVLAMHEGELKTASFLPMGNGSYRQMPYTPASEEEILAAQATHMKIDLSPVYAGNAADAVGEAFCSTDACEVKTIKENAA